ncbi:hypothetical protein [Halalkalibacter alkalisediminis]|uniref:Uncharacterized protein n=1 Tax=Halalkalibacter alkalisediminis TaxID=935616 RepID=A0ABV6NL21_9BACI|nr:hypothetical protein [Halalkalibacter alkalisediminis]
MIKAQLAKSFIENNEGLNHLLIKISPENIDISYVKVDVHLPYGISRLPNLTKYDENAQGSISFRELNEKKEIMFELYTTEEDVPLGHCSINILLKYRIGMLEHEENISITLSIVDENDVADVVINNEVITKLKELPNDLKEEPKENYELDVKSKVIRRNNTFSYLEEKYRVNY